MIDISSLAEKFVEKNKNPNKTPKKSTLSRNNFKFLYVIGKGGFGRVWKIQSKKTKIEYALKEIINRKKNGINMCTKQTITYCIAV